MHVRQRRAADEMLQLYRISFYASVLLFFYGTLFPFSFDVSLTAIQDAWSKILVVPYWDLKRGRVHSIPDIVSNILLTMPLGCFGFLLMEQKRGWQTIFIWGALGFVLACVVEVVQLAIPSRTTGLTDVVNNALGALMGAIVGRILRPTMSTFASLVRVDRAQASIVSLILVLVAYTLGPFDLTMSVSDIKRGIKSLVLDPWEVGKPISHEWIQMMLFGLFGGLVGRLARSGKFLLWLSPGRSVMLPFFLPLSLELGQLFVRSHAPSLRDIGMGTLGSGVGCMCGLRWPGLVRARTGLVLMTVGIVAAGLSPYRLVPWESRASFEWVPFVEYYQRTTAGALYDAGIGVLTFAVLATLFSVTFRCSRWVPILAVVCLAGAIEFAQTSIPGRSGGTTDVIVAVLGGWVGHTIGTALGHHRQPEGLRPPTGNRSPLESQGSPDR